MFSKLNVILLTLFQLISSINCNEQCWNNDQDSCQIKADLFQNLDGSGKNLSLNINCLIEEEPTSLESGKAENVLENIENQLFIMRRYAGIQNVRLDGCGTPLNSATIGLKFLPICQNITKLTLSRYHMDTLPAIQCSAYMDSNSELALEELHLQFNQIAIIEKQSFQDYSNLRDLFIETNNLKVLQGDSLRELRSLELLQIVNEPNLMLKSEDLLEFTSVVSLHFVALKEITANIFKRLPLTMQNLYISDTQFVFRNKEADGAADAVSLMLINALSLKNVTFQNCGLRSLSIYDNFATIKSINLNKNVLKSFEINENVVEQLDLSENHLEILPFEWFVNFTNLQHLNLQRNNIQHLSLFDSFEYLPTLVKIDVSNNKLESLWDIEQELTEQNLVRLRMQCDRNPWNCLWLHDFAHLQPEKFRILQYEKFISKINVNGLECMPVEKLAEQPLSGMLTSTDGPQNVAAAANAANDAAKLTKDKVVNVTTYTVVYGDPSWEFKRNQRAEALIIVFMLPLGIAFLFLLLYMWIYCQKVFHLSYYKDFTCMRRPPVPATSQRFDVIRHVPQPINNQIYQTNLLGAAAASENNAPLFRVEEGYEVPLNGIVNECNCKATSSASDCCEEKCAKKLHFTYETPSMPSEKPFDIYEEIIGDADDDDEHQQDSVFCNNQTKHYDHLTFE